ncbi:MAG: hypothetical protein ACMZ64_00925 [Oleiphilus sp.]
MDGLRPESDELDRFKHRSSPKAKVETPKRKRQPSEQQSAKSSVPFTLFVLIFISTATAFSWFAWQQHIEINALKTRLSDASGFMDQSKLLIARLEGKLSETGVELAQTGTAAEKKLAFLDSEMRKLWGVAYDRNKKAIETNQALVEKLDAKLSSVEKQQNVAMKAVNTDLAVLSDEFKSLNARIGSNTSQFGSLSNEFSVLRSEHETVTSDLKSQLNSHKKALDTLKKETQSFLERTAKYDLSIESINASRRQLNERIVEMDKKINALQLKISPAGS